MNIIRFLEYLKLFLFNSLKAPFTCLRTTKSKNSITLWSPKPLTDLTYSLRNDYLDSSKRYLSLLNKSSFRQPKLHTMNYYLFLLNLPSQWGPNRSNFAILFLAHSRTISFSPFVIPNKDSEFFPPVKLEQELLPSVLVASEYSSG